MSETSAETISDFGPWNPGIGSDLPARLLPLSTIFLADNVFTSVAEACELRELTGLELEQLVVFRPQRLVVHELLIRITGDISVPDGNKVEDLGINFRRITHTILTRHLQPRMREIVRPHLEGALRLPNPAPEDPLRVAGLLGHHQAERIGALGPTA